MPFISVDIEASGSIPGVFDMLSLGAVRVQRGAQGYEPTRDELYLELQPCNGGIDPQAMRVHGLSLKELKAHGLPPAEAARRLADWAMRNATPADPPIFVGYCANFDWAFVNDMFHRTGVENPFGYKALDIRALAMGILRLPWLELRQDIILPLLDLKPLGPDEAHNALADARHQAHMLCRLLSRGGMFDAIRLPSE